MKKLLCLIGGAMLVLQLNAQNSIPKQFVISDQLPDLPLHVMTNYDKDSAWLSTFGDKLIILDFWNLHCGGCIAKFPIEDSIQKVYSDIIQFVLITCDPKDKVDKFLKNFKTKHPAFSLPIVCKDSTIRYLFRHSGLPHYAFITPYGNLLIQGQSDLIRPEFIRLIASRVTKWQLAMKKAHVTKAMTSFKKPSEDLLKFIKQNKFLYND